MRKSRAFKLLANVCRLILACTFIVSGFSKVIDPWGTAMKVNEYLSIYGMESLQGASMAFSIWLCGAEMMMGCMLLFKVRIRLISIFALPISDKLANRAAEEGTHRTLIIEALVMIREGRNPATIRDDLASYLPLHSREKMLEAA